MLTSGRCQHNVFAVIFVFYTSTSVRPRTRSGALGSLWVLIGSYRGSGGAGVRAAAGAAAGAAAWVLGGVSPHRGRGDERSRKVEEARENKRPAAEKRLWRGSRTRHQQMHHAPFRTTLHPRIYAPTCHSLADNRATPNMQQCAMFDALVHSRFAAMC